MKNRALAVGLSAGLTFGAAACGGHASHEARPTPTYETAPQPTTPTTLSDDDLRVRALAESQAFSNQMERNVAKKSVTGINVAVGNCVYWPLGKSYAIEKDPAFYVNRDNNSWFSALVVIDGTVIDRPVPTTGPFAYGLLDGRGEPIPSQTLPPEPTNYQTNPIAFKPIEIVPVLRADGQKGWIEDARTHQTYAETYSVPAGDLSKSLVDICGQDFSPAGKNAQNA